MSGRIWHPDAFDRPEQLNGMEKNRMLGHLGVEIVEIGDDFLRARMPVDHRTQQPFGLLHGGASAVLAESVGSWSSYLCTPPGEYQVLGLEINVSHLRPARSGYVYGTARPIRLGSMVHVWGIQVTDEEGALLSVSRLTTSLRRIRKSR
ncbi:MAG: hotdog fold thioesterase [Gammaproteobacteria bacterium]|nr:hotdog fold thioesterase [Gammaproteobacteria bacterium]MCY4165879.1 hotdog fold thioesterase [Gammaproteobacteria bacterium]MCY4256183.1 hotdog fold thioesterase [Gammaproteobacteria bacterium]MCY4339986.1 hotdog fold thioesterase [Gammaproteobacteria bacterium]